MDLNAAAAAATVPDAGAASAAAAAGDGFPDQSKQQPPPSPERSVLAIDLNEIPSSSTSSHETLPSSPRDAFAVVRTFHDSVTPAAGAPADVPVVSPLLKCPTCGWPEATGPSVICDGCERGFHVKCAGMGVRPLLSRLEEWVCAECVTNGVRSQRWQLGTSSSAASSGRKRRGAAFLDINALPPSDGEGEVEEMQDSRRHSLGDGSFGGSQIGVSVAYPNFFYAGNGFGFQKAPGIAQTIRFGFEDLSHHTQTFDRCFQEIELGIPLGRHRSSNNTAVKIPSGNANESFLQSLREFISERHGMLGEGWRVELRQSISNCELYAVYCAPDGKTFESMSEVAGYLGLMSSNQSVELDLKPDGSAPQKRLHSAKRRKSSKISVANGFPENKELLVSGFQLLPGIQDMENFVSAFNSEKRVAEDRLAANYATKPQHFDNGLPVQFEDFYILSLGKVDIRPSYHDGSHIWPVGYKSCWHDKTTGSLFVCEVLDGGDTGPLFRVSRFACSSRSIPVGSTILHAQSLGQSDGHDKDNCEDTVSFNMLCDEDGGCIEMILSEPCPPMENDVLSCLGHGFNGTSDFETSSCLPFEASFCRRSGNASGDTMELIEEIGEFSVEGRTTSSVWRMASLKFIDACREIYQRKRTAKFLCRHLKNEASCSFTSVLEEKGKESYNLLAKFCSSLGVVNIPSVIQTDSGLETLSRLLGKWLDDDRFGLDIEFVQEIIERSPGVDACTLYESLKKRSCPSTSITVGNGSLLVKTNGGVGGDGEPFDGLFGGCKSMSMAVDKDTIINDHFPPPGKPLGVKLPQELVGDVLQIWESLCRFHEVLGVKEPFLYEELEEELISPWYDGSSLPGRYEIEQQEIRGRKFHGTDGTDAQSVISRSGCGAENSRENQHMFISMETGAMKEAAQERLASATYSRCTGVALAKAHDVLLKVLVGELQSKVAALVDPTFVVGDLKARRGRKKDADSSVPAKRMKLNLLPVNELTWPELARRYILAVLAMDGNLDSAEITARESGKVFRCLQGDGGVLCGSLPGVAGMEADALLLADAIKRIFGHLSRQNDVVTIEEKEPDATGVCERTTNNDGSMPEWARPLEPVRKLPTNVGTRIRKCVYEALDKGPPEWAKKILQHSISKEVYKGNASGPTKKAVLALLAEVCGEGPQQKPEKPRKRKSTVTISDIIMKQCRIILRRAAAADDSKVFCNLLGRKLMNSTDNDDEGLLGSPGMVSRPLDFRTIDLRLAFAAYSGSHEAFLEDVRELWSNVRSAYGDQPDYIELAETLSQNFESLYESEVVPLVQKLAEYAKSECTSGEVKEEVNGLLASTSEIPKAPWDEGVCKVCGIDKDDDSVLLCDTCDAEYHTYCLNPPLVRIPDGNWYCPSCLAGIQDSTGHMQAFGQTRKKKYQGDVTRVYLEELANLAAKMEEREYWDLSVNERTFLLKFMCDELLTSASVRQHLEHCAEISAELQQKLRSVSVEWKNLKLREELLAARGAKVDNSLPNAFRDSKNEEGLASSLATNRCMGDNISFASDDQPQADGQEYTGNSGLAKSPSFSLSDKGSSRKCQFLGPVDTERQCKDGFVVMDDHNVPSVVSHNINQPCQINELLMSREVNGLVKEFCFQNSMQENAERDVSSVTESQAYNLELKSIKDDISLLQDSIINVESQLLKLSVRKEFLGSDSAGRLYWVLSKPGCHPWVVMDGSVALQQSQNLKSCKHTGAEKLESRTPILIRSNAPLASSRMSDSHNCSAWVAYQSDAEIKELIEWLRDGDPKERELKEALMQWQKLKVRDCQPSSDLDHSGLSESVNAEGPISSSSLVIMATNVLEKKYGPIFEYETNEIIKKRGKKTKIAPEEKMFRCRCLEPVWPSRPHCLSCHKTFFSDSELEGHNDGKCNPGLLASDKGKENVESLRSLGILKSEGRRDVSAGELSVTDEHSAFSSGLIRFQDEGLLCPFKFEDVSSRFPTEDSNKQLVQEIGLISSDGVPSFVPGVSPYVSDSTLMLISHEKHGRFRTDESQFAEGAALSGGNHSTVNAEHDDKSDMRSCSASDVRKVFSADKGCLKQSRKKFSSNGCGLQTEVGRCCIIPQSSLRPLVGKGSQILRQLKINLLDMEAAIPEESFRPTKANTERRWALRAFVKSAKTIFEMVQATIVLEDMIKTQYLMKGWWYWSSLSAAAKTSTLSALALRIFSLDAAIIYDEVSSAVVQEQSTQSGRSYQAQPPGLDTVEKSKLGRRQSKRRKESEG